MCENILITGSSWFIWFHLAKRLLEEWFCVIWFDNENNYYDVKLKIARRNILSRYKNFKFYRWNLEDITSLNNVFVENNIDKVCNLAAQVGVRNSIDNPFNYIQSNIVWFQNVIMLSNKYKVKNFIYASSSSVYGSSKNIPYSITDSIQRPISLYAATKTFNEILAYTYSHNYSLATTWLRFFTVYWPWGRPDMAYFDFTNSIISWKPICVYNYGKMKRDFTYIDDVVEWIVLCLKNIKEYEIFNLWGNTSISLERFIWLIEKHIWKKSVKIYKKLQMGDITETLADIKYTTKKIWWYPKVNIDEWIWKFVDWYRYFYK